MLLAYAKVILLSALLIQSPDSTEKKGEAINEARRLETKVEKLSKKVDSLQREVKQQKHYATLYSSEISFHNGIFTGLLAMILALFGWGGWKRIENKYEAVKDYADKNINDLKTTLDEKEKERRNQLYQMYNHFELHYFEIGLNNKNQEVYEVSLKYFLTAGKFSLQQIDILKEEKGDKTEGINDGIKRAESYLDEVEACIESLKDQDAADRITDLYSGFEEDILKNMMEYDNKDLANRAKEIFIQLESAR